MTTVAAVVDNRALANMVNYENKKGTVLVDGRMLHDFLEVSARFNDWIIRMINYGFEEGIDYNTFYSNLSKTSEAGGRPRKEYALTLDMAKEICMIQRSEKGRQARKYFIECEKKLREVEQEKQGVYAKLPDFTNPVEAARAWADAEEGRQLAEARVQELAPKATMATDYIEAGGSVTFMQMADMLGIKDRAKFRQFLVDTKWCWAKPFEPRYRGQSNPTPWMACVEKVRAGYIVPKVWSKNGYTGMTLRWTLEGVAEVKYDMEAYGYDNE
ncbi:antA/AntB antirepressor family protein [Megasphaera sp. SW808]|uniref:antA/AntB antirepressor family protein n=1 Tax=Megasphaera sp. SW808 TaxID=2530045 RepID=UPI00197EB2D2|nr:antA/AntB antirepressor family protein [Megasphaera sp. SW808]